MFTDEILNVGLAQIIPVWLDKEKTRQKILNYITEAAESNCDLVVFGEAVLPGYPFWPELTGGAIFNSEKQKEFYARYLRNAVSIADGDLEPVCTLAAEKSIAVYLGTVERAADRGGHSLYCSLVYINKQGEIDSVHRKLQPTYDERLTWSQGDGQGLKVHKLNSFNLGGLNCWENWMPLTRASLYAQGENVHIAVWPGSLRNTSEITRFIALESRSWVISVSALMHKDHFPPDTPFLDEIKRAAPEWLTDGGSCVASPDGTWLVEPVTKEEKLICCKIDLERVYRERQNFDPSGHYSRPDVLKLSLNSERQSVLKINNNLS